LVEFEGFTTVGTSVVEIFELKAAEKVVGLLAEFVGSTTETRVERLETFEPKAVGPRTVELRTVEPRTVEPRTVEPRTVEPRADD
jgi:hypothetical protein